jgi:hypothetical protein
MSEHESPERPERRTEQEDQQYPGHGHPDELREKVGLPAEGEQRPDDDRGA